MSDPLMLLPEPPRGSPRLQACLRPPVLHTAARCTFWGTALFGSFAPWTQASLGILFALNQMQTFQPRIHTPLSLPQDPFCAPTSDPRRVRAPAVPGL